MLKCSVSLPNALHLTLASLASNSLASKFAPIPSLYIQVYHFVFKRQDRKTSENLGFNESEKFKNNNCLMKSSFFCCHAALCETEITEIHSAYAFKSSGVDVTLRSSKSWKTSSCCGSMIVTCEYTTNTCCGDRIFARFFSNSLHSNIQQDAQKYAKISEITLACK